MLSQILHSIKIITAHLVGQIIRGVDFIFPKDPTCVVLASRHGKILDGNSLALFKYLKSETDLKVKRYLRNKSKSDKLSISYKSLRDIVFFLRSQYVFMTHGYGDFIPFRFSSKKVSINLWHGIPMRGMGLSPNIITKLDITAVREARYFDFFLAPSKLAALRFNYCVDAPKLKYILCGQPRNDQLLNRSLNDSYTPALSDSKRHFLYAPTWRAYGSTHWFFFEDINIDSVNDFLKQNDSILLLRPHRTEKGTVSQYIRSHIHMFDADICPDVNTVLKQIDILITDYSSIAIDYLLCDRPIIFLQHDYETYNKYYNFLFEDATFWFPGEKTKTTKEFLKALSAGINGTDRYREQRKIVNSLLNAYQDQNSSMKLYKLITSGRLIEFKNDSTREITA